MVHRPIAAKVHLQTKWGSRVDSCAEGSGGAPIDASSGLAFHFDDLLQAPAKKRICEFDEFKVNRYDG
jgi:hypothetical protein